MFIFPVLIAVLCISMIFINVRNYDENTNLYVSTPEEKLNEIEEKSKQRYRVLIALFIMGVLILAIELFLLNISMNFILVMILSLISLFNLCFQSKFYTIRYSINIIPIVISNVFIIFFPNIAIYSLLLFILSNIYCFILGIKYCSAMGPWFCVIEARSLFFSGFLGMVTSIIFFIISFF